jgi:hypothetical protein
LTASQHLPARFALQAKEAWRSKWDALLASAVAAHGGTEAEDAPEQCLRVMPQAESRRLARRLPRRPSAGGLASQAAPARSWLPSPVCSACPQLTALYFIQSCL